MITKDSENNYENIKQINTTPSSIELILGFKIDLPEKEINELLEKSAKKIKNPKSIEIIGKMLERIKIERKDDEKDLKLYLRNEGKTKFYNVVQYDKLSTTIAAYYYSKKPNQTILSDK